jgi:glycosyltransferase involved in cell wall biosynthesis
MSNSTIESPVTLSVVIRTRNQAASLGKLLEALAAQHCSFTWEIVVVDHESQDETVALCERYKVRIVPIRHEEFTHGRSLNLGMSQARGEFVLICSAHSLPVGTHFLESVMAPFTDPSVAAVRCLANSDNQQLGEWYTTWDVHYDSLEEQKTAEAGLGWLRSYPSATCCAIRRSVWEQIPFDEQLEFMHDKFWASQVLCKGFKIRRSEAIYLHVRPRGYLENWRRENRAYRDLYRSRGYLPLHWSQFLIRIVRVVLLTPLIAMRYFVQNVMLNVGLVTIPWQAKFPPRLRPPDYFQSHARVHWRIFRA